MWEQIKNAGLSEVIGGLLASFFGIWGISRLKTKLKQDSTEVVTEDAKVEIIELLREEINRLSAGKRELEQALSLLRDELELVKGELLRHRIQLEGYRIANASQKDSGTS